MKSRDRELAQQLAAGLAKHERRRGLPGIAGRAERECLIKQLIESVRRVQFPGSLEKRDIWSARADPYNPAFDPIKAAILHRRCGDLEEAAWLVFLFVMFGKNSKTGYRLLRDVYAGEGAGRLWTWQRVSSDVNAFAAWLNAKITLWKVDGERRSFGPHRAREKLESIAETVRTYVAWIGAARSHVLVLKSASERFGNDAGKTFDGLYKSMRVYRFGRLAKFDYLAMLGKLRLAMLEPPSTYVLEGTGPLTGARLLYCGRGREKTHDEGLDAWLVELGSDLGVGQQAIEDALCNWQKSPTKFRAFRG